MASTTRRPDHPRRITAHSADLAWSSNASVDSRTDLLGRFSDAISLLTVVHASLAAKELRNVGDDEVAFRIGLDALKSVYNDFDANAARVMPPSTRGRAR